MRYENEATRHSACKQTKTHRISWERLKLDTSNLAWILNTRTLTKKKSKFGEGGRGGVTYLLLKFRDPIHIS